MKEAIIQELAKVTKLRPEEISNLLEVPKDEKLGDYAFPCFQLSAKLKKNPAIIARELSEKIKLKNIQVKPVNAYINFFIDKTLLAEEVISEILKQKEDYGKLNQKQKIVIDFSAPNVGKPMHIGHIRSTIIGDSLLRIHDFLGNNVTGINYLGDTGLHIGKLLVAWDLWLDRAALKKDPVQELLRLYVKFCDKEKIEYQEGVEEEFQDSEWSLKAKEKLKLLELGDKQVHKIWQEIQSSSRKGFDQVYKTLKVNFHETTGQSLFSDAGKKIITEQVKKGKAKAEPDGAVYVQLGEIKKYILRSNGTASYMTQDMGAAVSRFQKYKFDRMIYVTDYRQQLHFEQLFTILKLFGYDFTEKLQHLGFGAIKFGNEIMATRKGKVILLEDVLKKTIEKASEEIKKRKTKGNAETIGVGAIKYAVLKNTPQQDVNFSWEQSLNFEGNTGPYVQYSYARASSILRKAKLKPVKDFQSLEEKEVLLVKKLSNFPQIVLDAKEHLNPAILANYSFELAQTFNEFYHACPVIGDKKESQRLALVQAFRIVLQSSLNLLGIDVLEEM